MTSAYATVEYADHFLGATLGHDAWGAQRRQQKAQALNSATANINGLKYCGRKADMAQRNAFPREGMKCVPEKVMQACCLEAFALLCDEAVQARMTRETLGIESTGVGHASESYSKNTMIAGGVVSPAARRLLASFVQKVATLV